MSSITIKTPSQSVFRLKFDDTLTELLMRRKVRKSVREFTETSQYALHKMKLIDKELYEYLQLASKHTDIDIGDINWIEIKICGDAPPKLLKIVKKWDIVANMLLHEITECMSLLDDASLYYKENSYLQECKKLKLNYENTQLLKNYKQIY